MEEIAAPQETKYIPAFTVSKLEGKRKQEIRSFNAAGELVIKTVEEDAGWLVRFPAKGHTLRVTTKKELERLGFDKTIRLVDAEGDTRATMPNPLALAK